RSVEVGDGQREEDARRRPRRGAVVEALHPRLDPEVDRVAAVVGSASPPAPELAGEALEIHPKDVPRTLGLLPALAAQGELLRLTFALDLGDLAGLPAPGSILLRAREPVVFGGRSRVLLDGQAMLVHRGEREAGVAAAALAGGEARGG